MNTPITFFTYTRPDHTRRTVEALLQNHQAPSHDLIVFSDAARSPEKQTAVDEVRAYLATITGFRSVTIHHRSQNFGLAKSIIEGALSTLYGLVLAIDGPWHADASQQRLMLSVPRQKRAWFTGLWANAATPPVIHGLQNG